MSTVSRISYDNFFALGGNSLLAVTMAHRLSCELERPVPARELFAAPTLVAFAQRIELMRRRSRLRTTISSDLATEGQCEFRGGRKPGSIPVRSPSPCYALVEGGIVPDLLN